MESSSSYICCHGNLNELNIFKVMHQGHGEIDISFFDNLAYLGFWIDTNLPSSIFMFGYTGNSNELVSFEVKVQGHGEIDTSCLIISDISTN
jgi:hypothetical protein